MPSGLRYTSVDRFLNAMRLSTEKLVAEALPHRADRRGALYLSEFPQRTGACIRPRVV